METEFLEHTLEYLSAIPDHNGNVENKFRNTLARKKKSTFTGNG